MCLKDTCIRLLTYLTHTGRDRDIYLLNVVHTTFSGRSQTHLRQVVVKWHNICSKVTEVLNYLGCVVLVQECFIFIENTKVTLLLSYIINTKISSVAF